MDRFSRRAFLKGTTGAVAAAMAGPAFAEPAAGNPAITAETARTVGQTGIRSSFLGMGTGVKSWNHESALTRKGHRAFMDMLEHAYGSGIRYFDCADMYGSHPYMKEAIGKFMDRDELMILTKTVSRDAEGIKADVERFRRELDQDVLDVVLFHCLTETGWTEEMKAGMDVLEEAKAKGQIRAHGVSCHDYGAMVEAVDSAWTDVMLARINPFGVKMDGPPEEIAALLAKAKDRGKGVLGMKILGEGQMADRMDESLEFVTGLGCVDAITIGFLAREEIDGVAQALERVA